MSTQIKVEDCVKERVEVSKELEELTEFSNALSEKIQHAEEKQENALVTPLRKIKRDIEKWIVNYQDGATTFEESYEEIVSLYIFTDLYLDIDA